MIGKTGLRTYRSELRHFYFDFVTGTVLVRPRFDFGQWSVHPRSGMVIRVLTFHTEMPGGGVTEIIAARSPRNWPTSVTTPTAWPVPRSLTLVATAGLISTQTILTQLGSMLPVAIECSMEPRHSTNPAPFKCSA